MAPVPLRPWGGFKKIATKRFQRARIPTIKRIFIKKSNTAENFAVTGPPGNPSRAAESLKNRDSEDPEI